MDKQYIKEIISLALKEDIGAGDITATALVGASQKAGACLIAKSNGIICGMAFAKQAFIHLDAKVRFHALLRDGQKFKSGTVIARVHGLSRGLLSAERVALNFLSYLSAIATKTNAFVEAVKPYKAMIMDTRKTTPLLRTLERYAVRCGGGINHRFNLNDMAMIKDNHRAFCAQLNLIEMVQHVKVTSKKLVELEVDTLRQFEQALQSKADIILLDNMTPIQIRKAINLRKKKKSKVLLEASGGIHIKNVRSFAATGVDRISVGSLTHSRQALDISMEFIHD